MYDMIIIGAGTAGLTAAIYGVRAGGKILVLEKEMYGGQIIKTLTIDNYPGAPGISGEKYATTLYEQAIELGVEVKFDDVSLIKLDSQKQKNGELINEVKTIITGSGEYQTKTVVIATGAKNRKLGVKNEENFVGRGISYCAACDGAFFRNKTTAVVGGGNTALEDALALSNLCEKVYLIHRRNSFSGEKNLIGQLEKKDNVEFIFLSDVIELEGDLALTAITIQHKETKEKKKINLSGLFVAVGQQPDNDSFANLIQLDEKGYIIAGEDCITNVKGIFAAGDCRTKSVRQLTTAAADGAVAALAASQYFNN